MTFNFTEQELKKFLINNQEKIERIIQQTVDEINNKYILPFYKNPKYSKYPKEEFIEKFGSQFFGLEVADEFSFAGVKYASNYKLTLSIGWFLDWGDSITSLKTKKNSFYYVARLILDNMQEKYTKDINEDEFISMILKEMCCDVSSKIATMHINQLLQATYNNQFNAYLHVHYWENSFAIGWKDQGKQLPTLCFGENSRKAYQEVGKYNYSTDKYNLSNIWDETNSKFDFNQIFLLMKNNFKQDLALSRITPELEGESLGVDEEFSEIIEAPTFHLSLNKNNTSADKIHNKVETPNNGIEKILCKNNFITSMNSTNDKTTVNKNNLSAMDPCKYHG